MTPAVRCSSPRQRSALWHSPRVPRHCSLQPVPAIDKELTEEEKRVVGPMAYRDLYKRITAGMMTLRDRGLAVYNLADVFADQKGTIYADDIHVVRALDGESLGNNILAARIAELLAETWGLQKKPQ